MKKITVSQVSKSRSNYYNVFINGKAVSEIRFPTTNPYLNGKSLLEVATIDANRILSADLETY